MIIDMSKNKDNRIKEIFSRFRNPEREGQDANNNVMPPIFNDHQSGYEPFISLLSKLEQGNEVLLLSLLIYRGKTSCLF
jgi:hypothetical protein